MARPSDPEKRDKIIKAATTVFAQNSYTGTRIAEVAEAAGIGKGTIYEYFRSKEDLFFATFENLFQGTSEQIISMVKPVSGSVSHRLATIAEAVLTSWLQHLDLYGLVMEFWSATASSPARQRFKNAFKEEYAHFRKLIGALIQEGIDQMEFRSDIDPEQIASALIGSWDAMLLQKWFDSEFDPLSASRYHMKIVLAGLRSQPATQE